MTVTHPMYVPYEGLLTASGQVIALSSGARIDGTLTGSAEAFCISAEYADLERLTTSDKNGHFVFQALPTGRWGDPRTMLRKADQPGTVIDVPGPGVLQRSHLGVTLSRSRAAKGPTPTGATS